MADRGTQTKQVTVHGSGGGNGTRFKRFTANSGKPQTDKLFDHEIVERMGADFYREVFGPAVRDARASGQP